MRSSLGCGRCEPSAKAGPFAMSELTEAHPAFIEEGRHIPSAFDRMVERSSSSGEALLPLDVE